jgi:hypothetical protein
MPRRVPEDKCMMVMPEIEEEEPGMSLTDLMLGTGPNPLFLCLLLFVLLLISSFSFVA